ncbi:flagellar biosynthesis protein FlgL [Heyndrickxia shackletonii]|uniref:Flagellar biosynthesis protein FlgL n=1 Tax=Heyndrickxia shackletonii TaxID=157838 RepID=A0A0Q3TFZ9_9BACI|nr:flagellar hook-associated protein FlgL [Heyndrickxia shackletonii]KQL52984.1 flagellar biosynthesis protein FlgL [Heyndrickxia shackletonii]NEY98532.1 flagellar hook-associated protein FlgL [Heyndrickxia shackletonii]
MRVTQSMLSNNFLKNLSNSYDKMGKIQEQISSQKKITRPSDDPVVAMKGIGFRTDLQEVSQFKRNFSEAHNWVDNTDDALSQASKIMQRISEITNQASNGTLTDTERSSVAKEVTQLRNQLADIANTKVGEKYIFNGTDTSTKPVDLTKTPPVSINTNPVNIELSKGVYIQVNSDASNVFSSDLFDKLDKLSKDLESNNPTNIDQYIDEVNNLNTQIVNERATVGARSNRIDLMEDRIGQQQVSVTKMMSKNEDVDMEQAITDLLTQDSIQRAALGVGAKIIQPTLLDFLR